MPLIDPALRELGNNVRRERTKKGLSQLKLADKSELNIRNIQRIEKGEIKILVDTLKRIRKALGCSWEDLLGK